ncbi:MAG: dITP/XTP pyrophosphatase [Gammaproteobacteria bacterium]|nr:dITP/XTP pyrophosphatase [Gammaproteobacteria bacterium]
MVERPLRVVLASGNRGKVREIQAMLADMALTVLPQSDFNVPTAAETGLTFVENAILKARNAARHTGLPAIADDSGIEVRALNGGPGVHSAVYAGEGASDKDNLEKLLEACEAVPEGERAARFVCVMVYMRHAGDATPLIAQGAWPGELLRVASGGGGFGYDPIFFVPGRGCSSAQLTPEVKNRLSHRGQALRALVAQLRAADGW